jgi:hypothetical protein
MKTKRTMTMSNRYILVTSSGGVVTGITGLHEGDEWDHIDFDDHEGSYAEWRYDFDAALKGWATTTDEQAKKHYKKLIDRLLESGEQNKVEWEDPDND